MLRSASPQPRGERRKNVESRRRTISIPRDHGRYFHEATTFQRLAAVSEEMLEKVKTRRNAWPGVP